LAKLTFRGSAYRAQLVIEDLTGPKVPEAKRQAKPTFRVMVLPQSAVESTPFTRGEKVYEGDDIQAAWMQICSWCQSRMYFPKRLQRYLPPST